MGNSLGRKRRTAKVMKISGETFKLKTPVRATSVLAAHPQGLVLLDSEAVKHFGVRAKPLEPHHELKPGRLYFLVELPKFPEEDKATRRVRSGIQMSAKDRLESLLLARRSSSDLSIMKPPSMALEEQRQQQQQQQDEEKKGVVSESGRVRVRMRLPKAEVERLMAESKDGAEVAEKIVGLCMAKGGAEAEAVAAGLKEEEEEDGEVRLQRIKTAREKQKQNQKQKRVGFMPMPITHEEIHHLAVAS